MLTDEQKAKRIKGIGGSDTAAILGLSPWKTAVDVYLDKVEPDNDEAGTNGSWHGCQNLQMLLPRIWFSQGNVWADTKNIYKLPKQSS